MNLTKRNEGPVSIVLDKVRPIRYTHNALIQLSELSGHNALDGEWLTKHADPQSCLLLLWCGLLYSFKNEQMPTQDELASMLEDTDLEFIDVFQACLAAWKRAIGVVEEDEKKTGSEGLPETPRARRGMSENSSPSLSGSTRLNGGTGSRVSLTSTPTPTGAGSDTGGKS